MLKGLGFCLGFLLVFGGIPSSAAHANNVRGWCSWRQIIQEKMGIFSLRNTIIIQGKMGIFFPQEYNYYPGKLTFFSLRNTIICHFSWWILKQILAFWRCRAQPEPLKVSEKGEIWVKNRNFCASELHLWKGKVSFVWEGSVGRSKLFQILCSSLTISWQFRQDWSKKNSKFSLSCGN